MFDWEKKEARYLKNKYKNILKIINTFTTFFLLIYLNVIHNYN